MIPKPALLFICGFPSGGTDLAKNILNAHPEIVITGELPQLLNLASHGYNEKSEFSNAEELSQAIKHLKQLDNWNNLSTEKIVLGEADYPIDLTTVLKLCISLETVKYVGSKTPQFSENIYYLDSLFPTARYLFITRDIRDICLSWNRKWGKDYLLCASRWANRTVHCLDNLSILSSNKSLVISYENLVTNTDTVCMEICEFLKLPYSETMPEYHKHIADTKDGKLNYGKPIDASNTSKWQTKLDRKLVIRIEQIAYDAMQQAGYKPTLAKNRCDITKYEKYRGLVTDLSAIILVGNRAAENNGVVSRVKALVFEIQKYWRKRNMK